MLLFECCFGLDAFSGWVECLLLTVCLVCTLGLAGWVGFVWEFGFVWLHS